MYSSLWDYFDEYGFEINRKIFQDIVKQGWIHIRDDHKIRIESTLLNPTDINDDYWSHGDWPSSSKSFDQLETDVPIEEQIGNDFIRAEADKINQDLEWGFKCLILDCQRRPRLET